jgi:transposase-like protein
MWAYARTVLTWNFDDGPPQAGRHYPRDLTEFNRWFDSEADAVKYLTAVRFRHGFACPRCGGVIAQPVGPRWWCGSCRRWFTVTTGTLLERTKVPLATWLIVAWYLVQTKIGVSALSVQRITGVNYASAWLLLQKMRVAMDQAGRERLSGDVEFDETYVGGVERGAGGRSRGKKSPVAVACEVVSPSAMGRIRLARLPDASALAIADFLEQCVEPGSVLLCDDWGSYGPALAELAARGLHYTAKTTTLSKTTTRAHLIHPHVHRVASLLKRWLLGTHQGAVTDPHLDAYLDEFVFRFNRRNSRNRGLVFWRLVCALTESQSPVNAQQIRQRRADQEIADEAHAARVTNRRNAQEATRQRERRRIGAAEAGRTVRTYRRKTAADESADETPT